MIPTIEEVKDLFKVYNIDKLIKGFVNCEKLYKHFGSLNIPALVEDGLLTVEREGADERMKAFGVHIEFDIERKLTVLFG